MSILSFRYPYWVLEKKRNLALQNYGMEVLGILHNSLGKEGITYWLYGGTLLGLMRDGCFIPDDTDIDIGTWYKEEYSSQIERCLTIQNFRKNWEISIEGAIHLQRFEYKGVGVDFYYFVKLAEKVLSSSSRLNKKRKHYVVEAFYDKDAFDSIKTIKINGQCFAIPSHYDAKVLRPMYGDWKTSIPKALFNPDLIPNQTHHKDKQAFFTSCTPSIHSRKPDFFAMLRYYLSGKRIY